MADFDWDKDSVPVRDEGGAFDWEADSVPEKESGALSAIRGAEQGLTFNHADEALGFLESRFPSLKKAPGEFFSTLLDGRSSPARGYEETRDENRAMFAKSQADNPDKFIGGELGGGLVANVALPFAKANGLASAVGLGAGTGAVAGLGSSEAKDVGGMAEDAALGAGLGSVAGAAGHAIGQGISKAAGAVGRWASRGIDRAKTAAEEMADRAADKGVRVAGGGLGGDANAVLNIAQKAREALVDPIATAVEKEKAAAILENPEVVAAIKRAYGNNFDVRRASQKIGEMVKSEGVFDDALQAATPEARAAAAAANLSNPLGPIWRATKMVASRSVPPLVGAYAGNEVGDAIGGDEGKYVGTALGVLAGGVAGAVMGRPGTVVANALRQPSVKKAAWETVKTVLSTAPERLGKFAPGLMKAAQQGPAAFAVHYYVLKNQSPEAREALRAIEDGDD